MRSETLPNKKTSHTTLFLTLVEIVLALIVVGLIGGVLLCTEEIIEMARLHSQISQITGFDVAVQSFHDKFEGLPGDLLSVSADREGLPTGNGQPTASAAPSSTGASSTGARRFLFRHQQDSPPAGLDTADDA